MSNQLCNVAKFILCLFTALILHNNVFAQDKNKTITLVVPFSPGGLGFACYADLAGLLATAGVPWVLMDSLTPPPLCE